jgi:energy-coupling factor transporter ATP-binding protein EcfA2
LGEIFISHASADTVLAARIAEGVRQAGHSIFLDSDREDGIAPGAAWQRTLLRELRVCDAVVFLNSRAGQSSMWCHTELAVATELGKRVYSLDLCPDLPLHPLLGSLQGIRFDSNIDASIRRLTESLNLDGLAGSTRLRWERSRPPYPGLAAMDVADAGVFFGREDEVRDLVTRVDGPLGQRDGELVVVMGPSGAGKSSLVRAGLAARLALPQSGWAVASPFEPGIRPLDRLLSRLVALVPGQLTDSECRDRLAIEGMAAFSQWLTNHTEVPARRLLITLDQAEQLAAITSPRESEEFLNVLGGGMGPGSPVTVVMTVRSDRFDEIQRLPVIGPAIHAPFVMAPISRSQLAMVIEGPARRADLAFAPGLVSRLIDDAARGSSGETADALPFLAFVLREMYDLVVEEDRTAFAEADYERVGRIDGAIIRRTQAAETSLPPGSELVLDRLLPRFVTLSEERLPVARPVPRELLNTAEQPIVRRLEDQRLLVGTSDTVRLAHERLITAWPRLARTVTDRRDDLLLQTRVERQAADWKHGDGELLGRDATIAASSWLARRAEPGTNHTTVGEYIRASRAALRRRRARTIGVLSIIVALALAASAVAAWAVIQRSDAVRQSRLAAEQALLARAGELRASQIGQSLLLGIAAMKVSPGQQARSALINTLIGSHSPTTLPGDGTAPLAVAFTPDGHQLFTSYTPAGYLWDVTNRGQPHQLSRLNSEEAWSAAFSRDGHLLATGSADGRTLLWNTADLAGPLTVLPGDGTWVTSLAFSPDGRRLLTGNWDNSGQRSDKALLWDVSMPSAPRLLAALRIAGSGPVRSVAFSLDGRLGYTANDNGTVGIWDVAHPARTPAPIGVLHAHLNTVYAVTVSPDGQTLMTGSADQTAALWSLAHPAKPVRLAVLAGHRGGVRAVAFSPDGTTVATASLDNTAILWRIADRSAPVRLDTLAGDSQAAAPRTPPARQRNPAPAYPLAR